MSDGEIRALDPTTVERIAAGEVVERPASVVKELLENALDADASRVRVAVESGGKQSIRVSDDGIGMSETGVQRAVEEHTTSKISDIDDLERGVATLGFRGEALHAIGAVSRLTIQTRPQGGDRGTKLHVEGGDVTTVEPTGCPEGTTVTVEDLFYNVPARRKYLKQDATEFAHVNTVVTSYALANPDVAVGLEHDGRETFATTGQGNNRETVMSVYGREVAQSMIEVDADGEDLPDGPLDGVEGLISHPETNRSSREYLSTYVNGRYVRANAVREAVLEAYGSQLAPDRYPFAVLFCSLPAGSVDVNVHPRKLEVRFVDEDGVRAQIEAAVEAALLEAGLIRSSAPRGRSAPEQAEIAPESTTEKAGDAESGADSGDPGSPKATGSSSDDHSDAVGGSGGDTRVATTDASEQQVHAGDAGKEPASDAQAGTTEAVDSDPPRAETARETDRSITPPTAQTRIGSDDREEQTFDSLPSMRVLGQIHDTYVVAETDEGLVLIDQHAADERVNYERLRDRFTGETTTQALATPVELDLTAREAELFDSFTDALARLGFHANLADDRTVEVTTVPSLVADAADPGLLRDVLASLVAGEDAAAETVEAAADDLLADMACYPSITGNTSLTEGSMVDLLTALDDCENPYACPHGRPVLIEIDADEIADRFERDYPGHSG